MSKYGTIPAASSTPPAPPEGSCTVPDSTSRAERPGRRASAAFAALRPWRELTDPRALSVPAGRSDARRRARANLARFAANYKLTFLAVVSVSLLWQWRRWRSICLPALYLSVCLNYLSSKAFPLFLILALFQLVVTGSAASVLVALPVGLLLVGAHAVLHYCPAEDGTVDEEVGSIVWHRGIAPCDAPTAVSQQTSVGCS
ncbi:hypothetical protein SETIT_3G113900v2 [Setaria italica]|uniref:PRA1 family protein n=1 Tax=Setaria italica TaxID=4555 RepID=K3Z9S6_SETIT|nr:PRA1 family protein F2 [Setaria italica]RCV16141.1 hypothetical protein SETIT_3G113900v2 [Setaria italica]